MSDPIRELPLCPLPRLQSQFSLADDGDLCSIGADDGQLIGNPHTRPETCSHMSEPEPELQPADAVADELYVK
jgi:hypothetical protein